MEIHSIPEGGIHLKKESHVPTESMFRVLLLLVTGEGVGLHSDLPV